MDQNKLSRVLESMKEAGIEQLIISDPAAINYLTGRYIDCMERMQVLYLDLEGNHKFVIGKLFPQSEMGIDVVYFDDTQDSVELLAGYMRKGTKIGVDKTWPAKFLLRLMELEMGTEYINASFIIDEIRQIKSEEEKELMRAASKLNDIACEKMIALAAKGYNEFEMCDKLAKVYAELGADGYSFDPIIAYGDNAADPHHETDASTGKVGDCVMIDIGCKKDGYCSDMTRTVFIGEVSDEARKIYETVLEANLRGIAAAKPGARYCDVDNAARDYITEMGYGEYFTHRTGHNIGMEDHEYGDVSSINENILKPGMCFSVEPGIYVPGVAGVRIEDLVIITEDGCEVINKLSKELTVVPVEA